MSDPDYLAHLMDQMDPTLRGSLPVFSAQEASDSQSAVLAAGSNKVDWQGEQDPNQDGSKDLKDGRRELLQPLPRPTTRFPLPSYPIGTIASASQERWDRWKPTTGATTAP